MLGVMGLGLRLPGEAGWHGHPPLGQQVPVRVSRPCATSLP